MFARTALAASLLLASVVSAAACSCGPPAGMTFRSNDEFEAWKRKQAKLIVRGKVSSVRGDYEDPKGPAKGHATIKFNVSAVVKGVLPAKTLEIVDKDANTSCMVANEFRDAMKKGAVMEIEIQKESRKSGRYVANFCGYRTTLASQ
jgi:hypothetical protein